MRSYHSALAARLSLLVVLVIVGAAQNEQAQNAANGDDDDVLTSSSASDSGAIESSTGQNSDWGPVQILVPIIIGFVLILIGIIIFFLYRRHMRIRYSVVSNPGKKRAWTDARLQGPRKFGGLFANIKPVRSHDRRSNFSIDEDPDELAKTDLEAELEEGDPRRSTTSLVYSMPSQQEASEPVSLPPPVAHLPPIRDALSVTTLGRPTRGVAKPRGSRLPAVEVVSSPPRRGFKIDDFDSRSPTIATEVGHASGLRSRPESEKNHESTLRRVLDRAAEVLTGPSGPVSSDSRQVAVSDGSLIGEGNNGVMLISHEPGEDFSLASVTSPTDAGHLASPMFSQAEHSPPIAFSNVPPAPKQPPPPPPTSFTSPKSQSPRPAMPPASDMRNPFAPAPFNRNPFPNLPTTAHHPLPDLPKTDLYRIPPPPAVLSTPPPTQPSRLHIPQYTPTPPPAPATRNPYAEFYTGGSTTTESTQMHSAAESSEREYTVPNPFTHSRMPTQLRQSSIARSFDLDG